MVNDFIVWNTASTIVYTIMLSFLVKLHRVCAVFARLKKKRITSIALEFNHKTPVPCLQIYRETPDWCLVQLSATFLMTRATRPWPKRSIWHLAIWTTNLIVASTKILYHISQEHSLQKYPGLKYFLYPIAEGLDLVTMEGDLWKQWLSKFNPGLSSTYPVTLVTSIVEEIERFCRHLQEYAQSRNMFRMKDLTEKLTMDIIGRLVI